MILEQIYTSPKNLFSKVVKFNKGLNIIYAHSDVNNGGKPEATLHAVGKSMLLDFILFALLIDFNLKSSRRLHNAYKKKILVGSSVHLLFLIGNKKYKITRSFDNPNHKIYFGEVDRQRSEYSVGILRDELFNLIFHREDFIGEQSPNWYYKLLSYYIKDKKREELFNDPIDFSRNLKELDAAAFHLFLLNIDNRLPALNSSTLTQISKMEALVKDYKKLLTEKSDGKSIHAMQKKKSQLKNQASKLDKIIDSYKLTDNYEILDKRANELTAEIKKLWFQNSINLKKLSELKALGKASASEIYDRSGYVESIYGQVNELLANSAKRTLLEAVSFRKELNSSRKEFIEKEIGRLNSSIMVAKQKINNFDQERQIIFNELAQLNAFNDLKNAYAKLTKLNNQIADIDKSLKHLDELQDAIDKSKNEYSDILGDIERYLLSIAKQQKNFHTLISSVFKDLFLDSHGVKVFDISKTDERQKIKISVLEGSVMDSSGKNQLRTLIYDIAVSLNIIEQNLNAPRFIIHDGIFENLDKSHFFAFIKFSKKLSDNGTQFQYILTLNEHNYFNEFEDFEKNEILVNSIIELTPNSKLLGQDF